MTAYVIAPFAESKQGTYGSLGLAAALLLDLFLMSRLVDRDRSRQRHALGAASTAPVIELVQHERFEPDHGDAEQEVREPRQQRVSPPAVGAPPDGEAPAGELEPAERERAGRGSTI